MKCAIQIARAVDENEFARAHECGHNLLIKGVTSSPSVAECSAILRWARRRGQAKAKVTMAQAMTVTVRAQATVQAHAMPGQAARGWSRLRQWATDLRCPAARESCACASAHPA